MRITASKVTSYTSTFSNGGSFDFGSTIGNYYICIIMADNSVGGTFPDPATVTPTTDIPWVLLSTVQTTTYWDKKTINVYGALCVDNTGGGTTYRLGSSGGGYIVYQVTGLDTSRPLIQAKASNIPTTNSISNVLVTGDNLNNKTLNLIVLIGNSTNSYTGGLVISSGNKYYPIINFDQPLSGGVLKSSCNCLITNASSLVDYNPVIATTGSTTTGFVMFSLELGTTVRTTDAYTNTITNSAMLLGTGI